VTIIDPSQAVKALARWQSLPGGEDAAIIGSIDASLSRVILVTEFGGERFLEELEDDPLPRVC
jgi:hydrogenase expression/formation protein HypE